jgi:hypothetical protein
MRAEAIIKDIVKKLEAEASVAGAFVAGSLVAERPDECSDVAIGIVTRDNVKDFRKAYGLHNDLLSVAGQPLQVIELEQEHCKSATALYGRTLFPPYGLQVRLVYSQLKHVAEQMPYQDTEVIFDRSGEFSESLAQLPTRKTKEEIREELRQSVASYAFHLHDMLKAFGCKDRAGIQAIVEQMRQTIYFAAAVRAGRYTAAGLTHLSPGEKWIVENTCQAVTRKSIQKLTDLYVTCLSAIQSEYQIEQDVEQLKQSIPELLSPAGQ